MARTKGKGPAARQTVIHKAKNQTYSGPKTTDGQISHVKDKIQPQQFHSQYVKARMPVVLHDQLDDLKSVTKDWSNVEYLRKTGGDAPVKVEPMHKEKRRYGTDVERVDTTFGAFLDSLVETKDEYNYLTTQYSDDEEEDDEEDEDNDDKEIKNGTFPEPVRTLLSKDVPMRPELMGNLVLQQMNLWLGKSKSGASSGLHHDFHDNLYVLLKGRKRFVLYPPSAVHHLNTYGKPKKIHLNGLIVYKQPRLDDDEDSEDDEGDEIRPDGLVQREAAMLKVEALEQRVQSLRNSGKNKGLEKLEKEHEKAIDQMLQYQIGGFEEVDFDDEEEEEEDEELKDQVLRDDSSSKKRKAENELDGKASKAAKAEDDEDEDEDSSDEEDGLGFGDAEDDDSDADLLDALETAKNGKGPSEPLSFSQIPTQELHQHLGLTSPKKSSTALEAAGKPYIVDLKAGDMLYLPTSWFHEVTSFSDNEGDDVHIALNYWFHPPDAALQKFEHPYEDITIWKYMEEKVKKAYESVVAENEKN